MDNAIYIQVLCCLALVPATICNGGKAFFFFVSHMVPNNGDNFAVQQKVSLRGSRGKY